MTLAVVLTGIPTVHPAHVCASSAGCAMATCGGQAFLGMWLHHQPHTPGTPYGGQGSLKLLSDQVKGCCDCSDTSICAAVMSAACPLSLPRTYDTALACWLAVAPLAQVLADHLLQQCAVLTYAALKSLRHKPSCLQVTRD